MFTKEIYNHIEYHLTSANSKIHFNNKTEYLKHFSDEIVKLQNDVGLNHYKGNFVKLIPPTPITDSFENVLNKRKSDRNFTGYKLSLSEISTILHYSGGYNANRMGRKFTPSSGGFNSVEIFSIILCSDEVTNGIYHYNAKEHQLQEISIGKYDKWLSNHVFFQKEYADASMVLVLVANVGRLASKYLSRAYRLALLDTGHVSQNIYLSSTALNLNVSASGGFIESEIEEALNIDGLEVASFLTLNIGK
jgi:SagB-type dehydrogenase family enzyme